MQTSNSEHFLLKYGDLLYDLCESVLWTPTHAQFAFRSILKKLESESKSQKYSQYERSWVLQVTYEKLLSLCQKHGRRVSAQDQIELDANEDIENRLKQFEKFFHRLLPEDKILLILKDKYKIPFQEISSAMITPVGSLKMRRQQALRTLEEWLWTNP